VYGGAFVGMSAPSRLEKHSTPSYLELDTRQRRVVTVVAFMLAGAIAGGVHALSGGVFMRGYGGKIGFCSCVGAVAFKLLTRYEIIIVIITINKSMVYIIIIIIIIIMRGYGGKIGFCSCVGAVAFKLLTRCGHIIIIIVIIIIIIIIIAVTTIVAPGGRHRCIETNFLFSTLPTRVLATGAAAVAKAKKAA
jgi:hypothetical protein